MKSRKLTDVAALTAIVLGVISVAGILSRSPRVKADDDERIEAMIQRGFEIAPVPLNLQGKNPNLVGLGSYIMNAVSDCNACHNSGTPPNFEFLAGWNPYFVGQKLKLDPSVYLGGGQMFPPVGTPTGPAQYAGPPMISRNLTPDKTGRPEGGHTLAEFKQIIRHGIDMDHLHPVCTADQLAQINTGNPPFPNCIPTSPDNPVDGSKLQIMPWPYYSRMTDHELDAIYEYLKSIPCHAGPADPTDPLHNDCK